MKRVLSAIIFSVVCCSAIGAEPNTTDAAKEKSEKPDPAILLESTFIGDKEQPAVSYFIPWKGSGTPDKLQWNMEEKHDQTLQIMDREVLLNTMNIYNEMSLEGGVAPDPAKN